LFKLFDKIAKKKRGKLIKKSLRLRISNDLGCLRNVVRKKLFDAGVEDFSCQKIKNVMLEKKINVFRRGG
jgi:hypothetical protein